MFWAKVDDNGRLVSGYGVDRVERQANGTYVVFFTDTNRNSFDCAITALTDRMNVGIQASPTAGGVLFQTAQSGFLVNEGFSCIVMCPSA
jgi:hypothetical protein